MTAVALMVIDVETWSSGMPSNSVSMSSIESIATPTRPTSPAAMRVVGVVAHLRGQVEGDGQARCALGRAGSGSGVRFRGRAESGVLAHRPQPAAVHGRLDAARERKLAGGFSRDVRTRRQAVWPHKHVRHSSSARQFSRRHGGARRRGESFGESDRCRGTDARGREAQPPGGGLPPPGRMGATSRERSGSNRWHHSCTGSFARRCAYPRQGDARPRVLPPRDSMLSMVRKSEAPGLRAFLRASV